MTCNCTENQTGGSRRLRVGGFLETIFGSNDNNNSSIVISTNTQSIQDKYLAEQRSSLGSRNSNYNAGRSKIGGNKSRRGKKKRANKKSRKHIKY